MSDAAPLETLFIAGRATARRLRKARLTAIDGPDRGKSWAMDKARCVVGRSAVCEVCLNDRSVSGTHAEIEAVEEGWVLRDGGSTNGTFLGDIKVREVVLPLGARFRVGATLLQIDPGDGAIEIPLLEGDRWQELVGRSVAMRQVFAELDKIAPLDVTVLVTGETGTGKELVARAIHRVSKRASGPMVVQDCSSLPKDLTESILFGHERGAFTGANERRPGCFEQAHKGTVFLDEVGELEQGLQPKLLRVLEGREVRRLGGTQVIPVDVRVIAATHRDLRAMAAAGTFREDLFYRLGVLTIELPPLRSRREDIPLLARHLLEGFCQRNPDLGARSFSDNALDRLSGLPFPGNVRELRNVIERAASLADGAEITADDMLPASASRLLAVPARASDPGAGALSDELLAMPFKDAKTRLLEGFEPQYLAAMLKRHGDNITRSAAAAGLTRYHLRELCKRYGLRSTDNEPE